MEEPQIQQKLEDEVIVTKDLLDLKSILLYSKNLINKKIICMVPNSRYLKILSDYWALNAINVEGSLENYAQNYKYYYLTDLDNTGNAFKILRVKSKEQFSKCSNCDCGRKKRWINPQTQVCYYKEMVQNNYTTKIKQEENGQRRKERA